MAVSYTHLDVYKRQVLKLKQTRPPKCQSVLRRSRFYGGDYLLKYIIHKQDHDAGEDHDYGSIIILFYINFLIKKLRK